MATEGRVGKIRKIEPELSRIWVDFLGGLSGHFVSGNEEGWSVGDVLFCPENGRPERVADDLWDAGAEVGTVRLTTPDRAVIEIDGKLRSFAQRDAPFAEGQTVEIDDKGRPGQILSDEPVDRLGIHTQDDFDIAHLIIRPEENEVTLEDFGGSAEIVKRASDLVRVALDPSNPIKAIGATPIKGMVFTGPAGAGKTFLAKALANSTKATFYNIGGPAIVDQFVGQSEKRLRNIFEHAKQNRPAILFFDEIDSLYTQRGSSNHEATNRLVGQFLSLLDGFLLFDQVIVIATTNLPSALDTALLRPGRLAHKLEFTTPSRDSRVAILKASSRQINFSRQPNLMELADLTEGWMAADLAAIWTEAAILAALDRRQTLCLEDVYEAIPRVQRVTIRREKDGLSRDIS